MLDLTQIIFWKALNTLMYTDPQTGSTICGDTIEELKHKLDLSRSLFKESSNQRSSESLQ